MTAPEMHVMFRQYAQQMGMQNVRAILPEQIDLLLNTSTMDTVNEIIKQNIGITNDRIITDNSKIGQINALRSLYTVAIIDMSPSNASNVSFSFSSSDRNTGRMSNSGTVVRAALPTYMFLVDFSLNYKKAKTGYNGSTETYVAPTFDSDALVTNYFPVRIIDDTYLADTLNDFILKPRLRSPIAVTYNNGNNTIFDIYIDKFLYQLGKYNLEGGLLPYQLRMSYISKPATIRYSEDIGVENVDCNLPEYLHIDIVKHAVDLYHTALSGSLMAAQQQEQNARRENMRNNYRNEGNAQQ